jgi:phosphatidylglycerol lysyltransferase
MDALKKVSDSWLTLPGKTERRFMLGYFDKDYLNSCPVLVVRDDAQQVVGFLNQVPTKTAEVNVDLMRHSANAVPNVNDFMFVNFLLAMKEHGFKTANLGLCPLAGLSKDENTNVTKNILMFVYQNGNRFFGFNGLERFKNKFEPEWRSRYTAYQDGIVGFSRAMSALNKALRLKKPKTMPKTIKNQIQIS